MDFDGLEEFGPEEDWEVLDDLGNELGPLEEMESEFAEVDGEIVPVSELDGLETSVFGKAEEMDAIKREEVIEAQLEDWKGRQRWPDIDDNTEG